MKTEFKARFLQHLLQKKEDKGFTLIELLVVIIIIGILSAIALPAFMNQASKAKQSEAKQIIGSSMRAQQAYRLENPEFAANAGNLAIGIKTTSKNFTYTNTSAGGTVGSFTAPDGNFANTVAFYGNPVDTKAVRAYAGAAYATVDDAGNATTITLLCESNKPASTAAPDGQAIPQTAAPAIITTAATCASGKVL